MGYTFKYANHKGPRLGRIRVCKACLTPNDERLGLIHSEEPCDRCKQAPCWGEMVQQ